MHQPNAEEIVEAVAKQVRAAYILEYRQHEERLTGRPSRFNSWRQWDGKPDRRGRAREAIWPRIARRVLELRLDPFTFVSCQFDDTEKPPLPNELLRDSAVARYSRHSRENRDSLRLTCQAQQSAAAVEVAALMDVTNDSEPDCWCRVLVDRSIHLSALYRYCSAFALFRQFHDDRFKKICGLFRTPATLQYLRHAADYNEIWGDILPTKFVQRARENGFGLDWQEGLDA